MAFNNSADLKAYNRKCMRFSALPLGRFFGVETRVHIAFPLLLLAALAYGTYATGNPMRGLGLWLALLAAVVVREIARAVAAAYVGLRLRAVVLLPMGGVMAFAPRRHEDPAPSTTIVSIAGAAANLFIGLLLLGACYAVMPGIHIAGDPWLSAAYLLRSTVWLQFMMAALGLLPVALPQKPLLTARSPKKKAEDQSAEPASAKSAGFAIQLNLASLLSLFAVFIGLATVNLWLIGLGAFSFLFAQIGSPAQQALAAPGADAIRVRDVMLLEFTLLSSSDTLSSALEQSVHSLQDVFPVVRGDKLVGAVSRDTLIANYQSNGDGYLQGIMTKSFTLATPEDKVVDVLQRAAANGAAEFIPVVHDASLIGILTSQSLSRAVQIVRSDRMNLQRPASDG